MGVQINLLPPIACNLSLGEWCRWRRCKPQRDEWASSDYTQEISLNADWYQQSFSRQNGSSISSSYSIGF